MTRSPSDRLQPGRKGLAVFAATVIAFVVLLQSSLLERWELLSYDLRLSTLRAARAHGLTSWIARPASRSRQLVVVAVDDAAVDSFPERLPMSRRRAAALLRVLTRGGASVTVLDYFLHGRSASPVDDDELARAMRENGRVIIARRSEQIAGRLRSAEGDRYLVPHALAQQPVMVFRDRDAQVRRAQLFLASREGPCPGIALTAVQFHWSLKSAELLPPAGGTTREFVLSHPPEDGQGPLVIPIFGRDSMLLDLAGTELPFRVVPYLELEGRLRAEPDLLRGKIVLVGDTALASHDHHPVPLSPVGPVVPGVYVQGFAVADILGGSALRRVSGAVDLALLVLTGVIAAFLFVRFSPGTALFALVALAGLHVAACEAAFLSQGLWVGLTGPLALIATLFAESVWMRLEEERNARNRCEVLLSSYFSPAGVAGLEGPDDPAIADRLLSVKEMLAPNRYEIVSKLGQGGMSVVFRAIQQPIGRIVALKFMSPRLFRDPDARARFAREARVAGSMMHANLVAVFDSGESRGVPYMALEFVEGESLKSLIDRRRRLDASEAAAILKEALKGLAHIHAHGIVHRDIKSENILLSRDRQVKIADFGISKMLSGNAYETVQEIILGTPAYLAPELIRGDRVSPASDVYSMGIVLHEMLTGEPPFRGESTARILFKHVNEQPPDPASLGVDLPRSLAALLRRALEKRPEDRFQDAAAMLADVQKLYPDAQAPEAAARALASGKHATVGVPGSPSGRHATVSVSGQATGGATRATGRKPLDRPDA